MGISKCSPGCPCCGCVSTELLIVTCNANRITDDTYQIILNGHTICSVPSINNCTQYPPPNYGYDGACCSPADGAWITTNNTITQANITNIDVIGNCNGGSGSCQNCLDDNVFSCNTTFNKHNVLVANNELVLNATSDASCGNWGMVGVFGLAAEGANKWKVCNTYICDAYSSSSGVYPIIFDECFPWDTSIPFAPPLRKTPPNRGPYQNIKRNCCGKGK